MVETGLMDAELTSFKNKPAYTNKGVYVGVVENVRINLAERNVSSLLLGRTNGKLVEGGHRVAVPYRWVAAVGDIIILSSFPDKVVAASAEAEVEELTA